MYQPFDLSGRGAVVTGGNGGIGLGMARALLASGAKVSIWGNRAEKTEAARAQLAAECGDASRVHALVCDVGDEAQVDTAFASFQHGGWFGQGPGEGVVKRILPDSHTDFIFAVAAEEFGIVLCVALLALFAFIVLRGLLHSLRASDEFARLASAGLVVLFGVQSTINMAVNLNLMPAKGMTLPFISYGGSSMIATALQMGLVLALTRRRPAIKEARQGGYLASGIAEAG